MVAHDWDFLKDINCVSREAHEIGDTSCEIRINKPRPHNICLPANRFRIIIFYMSSSINKKATVSVQRCADYEYENVKRAVDAVLMDVGGIESLAKSGDRVLIKPNLLFGKSPDKAVNTHAMVVRAVMERLADCGAKMTIGDSPSMGTAAGAAKKCGISDVAKSFGVEVISFKDTGHVTAAEGRIYRHLPLSTDALDADVVINIAKLKTHAFMTLTLGVKNLFGCVVGMAKSQWHLKAGQDPLAFARMLVEIDAAVSPALTIMDGVLAMEGNGPGSGDPRYLGMILGSREAVAMDRVILELLGESTDRLPVIQAAREMGHGATELSDIELRGESLASMRVKGFKLPPPPLSKRRFLPQPVQRLLKRSLTAEPLIHDDKCTRCGTCVQACPPQIMSLKPMRKPDRSGNEKRLEIDRPRCIHCFCCQEVCPEGAITVRKGIFIRW